MVKVKDILRQTVVYVNEYSADMVDDFGMEAKEDLLAHIDAAARMVAQVAPANMQEAITLPNYVLTILEKPDGRLHGVAALPSDYMRLLYVISDKLYRPITVLLPGVHPSYAMQFCPIAGLGAGEYAPMGYEVDGTIDVHGFLADSIKGSITYVKLAYLAVPMVTGVDDAAQYSTLKEELRDVIAMQAAALYLGMNNAEKAGLAQNAANTMLKGIVEE